MLRATIVGARKNIPPFYFCWIQLVLKHLETKSTSVVLLAVCEQRSSQYFSLNDELHILSLTAIQKVKSNAQLVVLDSCHTSSFSKRVFSYFFKYIFVHILWNIFLEMYWEGEHGNGRAPCIYYKQCILDQKCGFKKIMFIANGS